MTKTWLIYALGGGWGHLTRTLSLGRLAATQRKVKIITNSPYAQQIDNEGCFVHFISENAGVSETCLQVREILCNTSYDRLIIDTFPRGLGGELADILPNLHHIPRILIHRDINPRYVALKKLRSFTLENFDRVIVPGEGKNLPLSDLPIVQYTAPWLIRNCWELTDKMTMRSHILKVEQSVKTILVCASGKKSELALFGKLAQHLQQKFSDCAVRILAATCPSECPEALWVSHHPGIECIAAADVVVGGAGYNTVYECGAVGVPLVALALERLYDRQANRAKKNHWVQHIANAIFDDQIAEIDQTVQLLLEPTQTSQNLSVPFYINGAVQAVEQIEQTW